MHLRKRWFILTLVVALLSACSAPVAQTQTARADVTAEPTTATAEPTAAPSPTVEPTAAATPTPQAAVIQQFIAREFTRQDEPKYEFLTYHSDGPISNVDFEDGDPAEARAILDQWFIGSVWQLYDDGTFTFSPPDGAPGREVFGEFKGTYTPGSYAPESFDILLDKSVAGYEGTEILIRGPIESLVRPGIDHPYAKLYLAISYPLPDGRVARINASINYLRIEKPETPVEVAPAPPAPVQATAAPGSADMEVLDKFNIVSVKEPGTTDANEAALIEQWFVGGSMVFFKSGLHLITLAPDAPGGESFGQLSVDIDTVSGEAGSFTFTIERSAEGIAGAQLSLAGKIDIIKQEIELSGTMIVPDGSGGLRNATLAKTILTIQR